MGRVGTGDGGGGGGGEDPSGIGAGAVAVPINFKELVVLTRRGESRGFFEIVIFLWGH